MSGNSTKKPSVCEAQLLVFGTSPDKPNLYQAMRAVVFKETSSHVALKVRFSEDVINSPEALQDPALSQTVADIRSGKIPSSVLDENGQTVYEAYVSFGPTGSGFVSTDSALGEYWADCLSSGVLTPAPRILKGGPTGRFDSRLFESFMPIRRGAYNQVRINVPGLDFVNPQTDPAKIQEVAALNNFQQKMAASLSLYQNMIGTENAITKGLQFLSGEKRNPFQEYLDDCKKAILELRTFYADNGHPECKDMNINTFVRWLEFRGVSFGLPPRDTTTIKLATPAQEANQKENADGNDPALRVVLNNIKEVNDNKFRIPYIFSSLNCADVVKYVLTHGQTKAASFVRYFSPDIENVAFGFFLKMLTLGILPARLTTPNFLGDCAFAWNANRSMGPKPTAAVANKAIQDRAEEVRSVFALSVTAAIAVSHSHEAAPRTRPAAVMPYTRIADNQKTTAEVHRKPQKPFLMRFRMHDREHAEKDKLLVLADKAHARKLAVRPDPKDSNKFAFFYKNDKIAEAAFDQSKNEINVVFVGRANNDKPNLEELKVMLKALHDVTKAKQHVSFKITAPGLSKEEKLALVQEITKVFAKQRIEIHIDQQKAAPSHHSRKEV